MLEYNYHFEGYKRRARREKPERRRHLQCALMSRERRASLLGKVA